VLHVVQPLARLRGRLGEGLTPWRGAAGSRVVLPRVRSVAVWSERWRSHEAWLLEIERALDARRAVSRRGGAFARWDLEVRGGALGRARLLAAVEEHGAGRQFVRVRAWLRPRRAVLGVAAVLAALAVGAALDGHWAASGALTAAALALGLRVSYECGAALAAALAAVESLRVDAVREARRDEVLRVAPLPERPVAITVVELADRPPGRPPVPDLPTVALNRPMAQTAVEI
jgi:hypothetical protein